MFNWLDPGSLGRGGIVLDRGVRTTPASPSGDRETSQRTERWAVPARAADERV